MSVIYLFKSLNSFLKLWESERRIKFFHLVQDRRNNFKNGRRDREDTNFILWYVSIHIWVKLRKHFLQNTFFSHIHPLLFWVSIWRIPLFPNVFLHIIFIFLLVEWRIVSHIIFGRWSLSEFENVLRFLKIILRCFLGWCKCSLLLTIDLFSLATYTIIYFWFSHNNVLRHGQISSLRSGVLERNWSD